MRAACPPPLVVPQAARARALRFWARPARALRGARQRAPRLPARLLTPLSPPARSRARPGSRYVYLPLDAALYLLLVTNKGSNIVEDLDTLRLLSRVIPEQLGLGVALTEANVNAKAFELLFAFDEVLASGGYREEVTLHQVRAAAARARARAALPAPSRPPHCASPDARRPPPPRHTHTPLRCA